MILRAIAKTTFTTHEAGEMVDYDPNGKPISSMDKLGLDGGAGIVINSDGLLYVTDNQGIEVLREKWGACRNSLSGAAAGRREAGRNR